MYCKRRIKIKFKKRIWRQRLFDTTHQLISKCITIWEIVVMRYMKKVGVYTWSNLWFVNLLYSLSPACPIRVVWVSLFFPWIPDICVCVCVCADCLIYWRNDLTTEFKFRNQMDTCILSQRQDSIGNKPSSTIVKSNQTRSSQLKYRQTNVSSA